MEPESFQAGNSGNPETGAGSPFRWDAPGKPTTVFMDFDLVDRLGFEIMRGFGAVPKRGAEVGGILLGSAEIGERTLIRIEDFVAVPCEYLRGPSYLLSDRDKQVFDEALERWRSAPDKRIYAVGYYRSNTRDTLQLGAEDLELLESRFPATSAICLQVKPYATRASEAAFFLRENGRFQSGSRPTAFPFRRREMGGGKAARRPNGPRAADVEMEIEPDEPESGFPADEAAAIMRIPAFGAPPAQVVSPAESSPPDSGAKARAGWFWIPLSFIFLLLGVVMGFQIALTYRGQQFGGPGADPYSMDLTVAQFGESMHLKWNTEAAAMRGARRGLLRIRDGDNTKEVELGPEDLRRGGALYRNVTPNVTFRLEVYRREHTSVAESVDLRALGAGK